MASLMQLVIHFFVFTFSLCTLSQAAFKGRVRYSAKRSIIRGDRAVLDALGRGLHVLAERLAHPAHYLHHGQAVRDHPGQNKGDPVPFFLVILGLYNFIQSVSDYIP